MFHFCKRLCNKTRGNLLKVQKIVTTKFHSDFEKCLDVACL